ncbi:MAG: Protein-L-isoaspartate O-methyltransferase [Anaerolineae bacterium]|nr:Protein-L-isoaspartate O-methyltransferase [Anaerolineae bacterium]
MFEKTPDPEQARADMVAHQLASRDITDPRVLKAMGDIPRHRFVSDDLLSAAYQDRPLAIGFGQTISQPYIVAYMTQALALPTDEQSVVLEIGTGSGYQAAILSQLAAKVYTIERVPELAERARKILHSLEIFNVEVLVSDGGYGCPDHSPYDGILVTAAAPHVPPPLTVQLKNNARLIVPVGAKGYQDLVCIQRQGDRLRESRLAPVAFVPLRGEHGWQTDD